MPQKRKIKLLFICLGNICRSPAAEEIMRRLVQRADLDDQFQIDSAGIGSWHIGQLPDRRMRLTGEKFGYRFTHRARQFNPSVDFNAFDLILVMDDENYNTITGMAANQTERDKVKKLARYMTHHGGQNDIPDPYFGGMDGFDKTIELLEDACAGLLQYLQQEDTLYNKV